MPRGLFILPLDRRVRVIRVTDLYSRRSYIRFNLSILRVYFVISPPSVYLDCGRLLPPLTGDSSKNIINLSLPLGDPFFPNNLTVERSYGKWVSLKDLDARSGAADSTVRNARDNNAIVPEKWL